ncbi:MAG: hypothetical protein ACJ8FC_04275 [Sphingomicrobium sp.]
MNQFEMVAIIVVAVMIASVFRAKYGYGRRRSRGGEAQISAEEQAETLRLREEVKQLKERINVLERITVEKENSLARQIEELRDQ